MRTLFCFSQCFLSSISVPSTSERSFKQSLNSFKVIVVKQNFDHILLLLKKLCWFPFSYRKMSKCLIGISLQFALKSSAFFQLVFGFAAQLHFHEHPLPHPQATRTPFSLPLTFMFTRQQSPSFKNQINELWYLLPSSNINPFPSCLEENIYPSKAHSTWSKNPLWHFSGFAWYYHF